MLEKEYRFTESSLKEHLAYLENKVRKDEREKIFKCIDKTFNCCGYIEDIEFDKFKETILKKLEDNNE